MSRRAFLARSAAGAAGAFALPAAARAEEAKSNRPNLIVIMADDCSAREFGCYGHPEHKTPNLDRLAKTGVMFRTCWATPICSPSRAEIMTGRYGFRTKWYHNDMKVPKPLSDSHLIFSQVLKQAGYATAITGKWQLPGKQQQYGFDEHCMWRAIKGQFTGPVEHKGHSLPGRPARYWHPAVVRNGKQLPTTRQDYGPDIFVDFIQDFAARHRDQPFLIYLPMCLPHVSWDFDRGKSGYLPTPKLDAQGHRVPGESAPTLRANVEYIDHLVGRIVDGLEQLGLRDRTVIMFTCDNGTAGYGKAHTELERGPLVPMIVNGPGIVKPQGPSDALVDFSDLLPTLADFAGARLPDGYQVDGRSFAPLLRGEPYTPREWIFCCYYEKRFLRDRRWLLDGNGRLYDCGASRTGEGYKEVTESADPDVAAARRRFATILEGLPAPDPTDPWVRKMFQRREEKRKRKRAQRRARRAAREKPRQP